MRDFTFCTFYDLTSSPIVFQSIVSCLVKFGEELVELLPFLTAVAFWVTCWSCVTSRWLKLVLKLGRGPFAMTRKIEEKSSASPFRPLSSLYVESKFDENQLIVKIRNLNRHTMHFLNALKTER